MERLVLKKLKGPERSLKWCREDSGNLGKKKEAVQFSKKRKKSQDRPCWGPPSTKVGEKTPFRPGKFTHLKKFP